MVDIRQMRYFVAVAETLHFGRAAARLHLSQPPLTRQIAALERDLGVRLLQRHSRHASLTQAGQRFLQDARATLARFDEACRNARLADRGELGELTLGFMMHAAYTVVPSLTRGFIAAFPGIDVTLCEVVPGVIVEEVLAGRFDVGIAFPPGLVRDLGSRTVHRDHLCAALHSSHRLAGRDLLAGTDLDGEPLIATPRAIAPTLRTAIDAFFHRDGLAPLVRLEVQLQQTILSLVAENLGLALVPRAMRRLGVRDVVFVDLVDPPPIEHVVVWRPDNPNPALASFLTTLGAE